MDINGVFTICQNHGYRNIPSSQQVFRDVEDLDKNSSANYDNLLDLAALIEFIEKSPAMFLNKKDQIDLSDYDSNKIVCLSLYSDDVNQIEKFRALCYANLSKDMGWFHQCNAKEYQMFEFWNPQTDAMRNVATLIANDMAMPVVVCLKKVYRPDAIILHRPFEPFNPEGYYQQGSFN